MISPFPFSLCHSITFSFSPLLTLSLFWWPTFHADNARTGASKVNFPSANFRLLWTFSLGEHVYRYEKGASVWSASPAIGEVEGRTLIFAGAYEHNLYAVDARTGEMVWRYTAGRGIYASPSLAEVDGKPLVFFAANDRTVYSLDARKGEPLWKREARPWSYMLVDSFPSSPLVAEVGGRTVCFVPFWFTERRPLKTVEVGEILALEARTGKVLWRRTLASSKLTSPSMLEAVGEEPRLFIASEDGRVFCLSPEDGRLLWTVTLAREVLASPTIGEVGGRPVVVVGTQPFGDVNCLDALTGRMLWSHKAGHGVLSTAALAEIEGKEVLFFGSLDRCVYALLAGAGRALWRFPTGKYVVTSPAVAKVRGREMVFVYSLDNRLYGIDARTGEEAWRFETGDMLWPYETRAASIWSSPAVGMVEGRAILVLGGHDGKLYAFTSFPPRGAARSEKEREKERGPLGRFLNFVPAILGLSMLAAGVLLSRLAKPSEKGG